MLDRFMLPPVGAFHLIKFDPGFIVMFNLLAAPELPTSDDNSVAMFEDAPPSI